MITWFARSVLPSIQMQFLWTVVMADYAISALWASGSRQTAVTFAETMWGMYYRSKTIAKTDFDNWGKNISELLRAPSQLKCLPPSHHPKEPNLIFRSQMRARFRTKQIIICKKIMRSKLWIESLSLNMVSGLMRSKLGSGLTKLVFRAILLPNSI